MAEYIDRKRAIVDACNSLELYPSEYAKLEDALNKTPAVEVEPVRHGRWIHKNTCGPHTGKYHCSECNRIPKSLCIENFCPNCGAKMDLEAENNEM